MIELTRRATFSASHYYWNDAWSQEKNERGLRPLRPPQRSRPQLHPRSHRFRRIPTLSPVLSSISKWLKDVIEDEVLAA